MKGYKILVPVDFTSASENAIRLASIAAEKSKMGLTLLHVETRKSGPESEGMLRELADKTSNGAGIDCNYIIRQGDIFTEIPQEACDECYKLVVLGTHGFKGLREKFLGSDILKLAKMIPVPAIVIQKDYLVQDEGLRKIVFPAGTHKAFPLNIEATILVAGIFDAEVHLYTVEKPGQEWSDELKKNIELAKSEFEKNNIRYHRINETQTTFSLGYSKQILKYATDHNADLIAVMSIPTPEHYYFADSDKEMLLTNEASIPVLSTSGKQSV